jgi:hypothetical protein
VAIPVAQALGLAGQWLTTRLLGAPAARPQQPQAAPKQQSDTMQDRHNPAETSDCNAIQQIAIRE